MFIEHYDDGSAVRGCLRIIHLIPSAGLTAQINSSVVFRL